MEPTRVKHLSAAPLKGRLLLLPVNIISGSKCLPGTNALTYFSKKSVTKTIQFITLTPVVNVIKPFSFLLTQAIKLDCLSLISLPSPV